MSASAFEGLPGHAEILDTVDNRLTRISELTGIDLTSPHGTASPWRPRC
ncbi:hypothetical protein AB0B15_37940 [Streptomyces sp. NPDC045456]